jgi:hypothetical protein
MGYGTGRRSSGEGSRFRQIVAALALVLAVAGCTVESRTSVMPAVGGGATIAFESIDGAPLPVFQRLVRSLTAEAQARQVRVVSRETQASYRIRGYLAAHVESGRIHIGWVWDVYDADKRRVLRIAGEEPGVRKTGDAWAVADDQMVRRIARASMDPLVAFLGASDAMPAPPPAAPPGANIAGAMSLPTDAIAFTAQAP